jgi:hypothetical protein
MQQPKRGPGRPRTVSPKPKKKTAKLVGSTRFLVSLSEAQKTKLAGLAQASGITEAEQIRRMIDEY